MTPKEETYFQTKKQLQATIAGYMGGRVAEEVFFGDVSSGAHNDIEQATRIARLMVTELGMSELGFIKYASSQNSVFLGRDYTQTNNEHSGETAHEIDKQVRKIIDACYMKTQEVIATHKDKLIVIAEALLEYETLTGEQIESLYHTGKMPAEKKKDSNDTKSESGQNDTPKENIFEKQDDLLDDMK